MIHKQNKTKKPKNTHTQNFIQRLITIKRKYITQ